MIVESRRTGSRKQTVLRGICDTGDMNDAPFQGDAPRQLAWILPLLAIPVIFFGLIIVAGILQNNDDPVSAVLWRVPYVGAFVGVAAALTFSVIAALRIHSRWRSSGAGSISRLAQQDADSRGLSREEYGVYKGSVGSAVTPVNSAGGLLVISLVLTVIGVFLLVLIGVAIAQDAGLIYRAPDATELTPVMGFFLLVALASIPVSWRYYVVERRAQKLREARGLPGTLS